MTRYNVHLFREMRLTYENIEADTPQAAASLARQRRSDEADNLDDCDGENLAALVDLVGDDQYAHSVMIDFAEERLRQATPDLLAFCQQVIAARQAGETVSSELYAAAVLLATLEGGLSHRPDCGFTSSLK